MKFKIVSLLLLSLSPLPLPAEGDKDKEVYKALLQIKDGYAALRDKDYNSVSSVAIGDEFSIAFQVKSASAFLAEYYQRVLLFGGTAREGDFLLGFQLQMNTGGRTHVLLYRHLDAGGHVQFVTFKDRFGEQTINVTKRVFHPESMPLPEGLKKEYIGTFSGESYPNKFLTPLILAEQDSLKKMAH